MKPFDIDSPSNQGCASVTSTYTNSGTTSISTLLRDRDLGFDFDQVLREEGAWMDRRQARRPSDGKALEDRRFSLAFSGGGIRAAAFQAGVLWRLAKMNRLKDVEHIAAVSGGSYIATAFASHCLSAEPPLAGSVREWYLRVVAATLCRMQANAGDFVRDCVRAPGYDGDGAGYLPRVLDLPVLLIMLVLTLLVNPVTFVVAMLIPAALNVQLFFGPGMLAAFCMTRPDWSLRLTILQEESPIQLVLYLIVLFIFLYLFVFALRRAAPCCRTPRYDFSRERRREAHPCYFFGHAAMGALMRAIVLLAVLVCIIIISIWWEKLHVDEPDVDSNERWRMCEQYIAKRERARDPDSGAPYRNGSCLDAFGRRPWWNNSEIQKQRVYGPDWWQSNKTAPEHDPGNLTPGALLTSLTALIWFLSGFAIVSFCCMPCAGRKFSRIILVWVLPGVILVLSTYLLQFIVFGPITDNKTGIWLWYDEGTWHTIVTVSIYSSFILVPLYGEIRAILHTYYRYCLQRNFFRGGKDSRLVDLVHCNLCPLLILTATTTDFRAPGDSSPISEMFMSPLHSGSIQTGYLRTPHFASLSKSVALSGAGCLDAVGLSMTDALSIRIWSQVTNLSWGDYMWFERRRTPMLDYFTRKLMGHWWEGFALRFLQQFPSCLLWWVQMYFLKRGWYLTHSSSHDEQSCQAGSFFLFLSLVLIGIQFLVSFFSVLNMNFFVSPLTRELLKLSKYIFVSEYPPRLLYMTDGGVRDCTAMLQLLQRRCRRILLVLAAADVNDDLGVLRVAMREAQRQKIGSFFDPIEPRRCVDVMLEHFKLDKSAPYIRLGIYYSWHCDTGDGGVGYVYIVKNRLPPDLRRQPLQPLLTEAEICGETIPEEQTQDFAPRLTTDELGPYGCCDCCHDIGLNCGPKFPHGNVLGYLYLTPQWFNSLARLGFVTSAPVIEALDIDSKKPGRLTVP